jgi:D-alanine-D-alanine ligase
MLVQVNCVRGALKDLGYSTMDVPTTLDLGITAAVLKSSLPLIAFNLAETINGKGRLIHLVPSLLDSLGIPYTGSPSEAIYVTSHKLLAKRLLESGGVRSPPWISARSALVGGAPFPPPYIIKSIWEHASIGLEDSSIVHSVRDLPAAIGKRAEKEGIENIFVEGYIEGREFNIALLADGSGRGPRHLPPAEIDFVGYPEGKPRIVGYQAKWAETSYEYSHTPQRYDFPPEDAALLETMVALSGKCWDLFGLHGYARVDFRVDAARVPWVLEVNSNPCISPDAGFMAAANREGLTLVDVVRCIMEDTPSGVSGKGPRS